MASTLDKLPSEIIQQVLSYLDLYDVVEVAHVSRRLSHESYDDQIWSRLINSHLRKPITSSKPFSCFRDLYISHHPRWFVAEHSIWFNDSEPLGKILLSRFNPDNGSIEAYTIAATRTIEDDTMMPGWSQIKDYMFTPSVTLDFLKPALRLDPMSVEQSSKPKDYSREILMESLNDDGLRHSFFVCRTLPTAAITEATKVWPPLRFPAIDRTRNQSHDSFRSKGHQPEKLSEISHSNFRVRKWIERQRSQSQSFSLNPIHGLNILTNGRFNLGSDVLLRSEGVATYATLPSSCYLPTTLKPWQGIWCGDYSAHGCEFLLITQPDDDQAQPLPDGVEALRPWLDRNRAQYEEQQLQQRQEAEHAAASAEDENPSSSQPTTTNSTSSSSAATPPADHPYTGRLEALKLTGDPNVPRGEYTFIAPDIGHAGVQRVADDHPFAGIPIVQCCGHIHDFQEDRYTPTWLMLISQDRIAQYWAEFRFVSFYRRVDLDALWDGR